ncbi:MAG: hypothetical protein J6C15_05520 [Bacteroidaceae bacterium]|nr:hypothetical protein [Bacteroidaceae bacterium]
MTTEELKKQAAIIRDEKADSANTAERVGNMFLSLIEHGENADAVKIGLEHYDNSIEADIRKNAFILLRLLNAAGDVLSFVPLMAASEQYPGLMSIAKVKQLAQHQQKITALDGTLRKCRDVEWGNDNLNYYTTAGLYRIHGERTYNNDNFPLNNVGGGHSVDALLTVLDSSISDAESCITQILALSNRVGVDGDIYIRTASGTKDNLQWEPWSKLQTNTELGVVASLDTYIDNGIYSGVHTDGSTFADTFVMIVINNYAVAKEFGVERSVSQYKYALGLGGSVSYTTRVGNGTHWGEWMNKEEELSNLQMEQEKTNLLLDNMVPVYAGVVESATLLPQLAPSYTGIYYIASEGQFAAQAGSFLNVKYYSSWLGHEIYNRLGAAISNRIYYNSGKKILEYFNGTSFENVAAPEAVDIAEIKEFLSSDFLEQTYAYGVEWDTAVTTPECTRIGSMNLHRSLPVQSAMRGCLLNDNGVVVEYLPADDWTTAVRDGSKGQVMVEIPKHYRKFVTDGTKRQVWLSMMPLAGYHEVPKVYVGAYEAALDRTNLMLASVVNATEQYRGGDNTADWDGTYRSLLGKPMTNSRVGQHITYARKRKANSSEWNAMTYDAYKTISWLFIVEYATRNSQAAYNAQPTIEGFKQGGLGEGVTTLDNTTVNNYNLRNPIIDCGTSDILGNNTGEVEYIMPGEYSETKVVIKVNRYRGIEMPFGHTGCCLEGIAYVYETSSADYADVYVCSDPELFYKDIRDVSHLSNYKLVGQSINTKGHDWYLKDILFGDNGEIIPTLYSGGSNTNYCDVVNMMSAAGSPSGTRYVDVGGYTTAGAAGGLFCQRMAYNGYFLADRRVGTRLCFIPKK